MMADDGVIADPRPFIGPPHERQGWGELEWIQMTDRRDSLRIYTRLGVHAHIVHGVNPDGSCTCWKAKRCSKPGKHPILKAWEQAPLDLESADQMLVSNWRYNVGIRMGRQPGGFRLLALDVDGPRELLAPLEAEHGPLPRTLTARTGSGGLHFIFKIRDDMNVKNAVRLSPGVDTRVDGGHIVVAPSRHYSGGVYQWVDCREPVELPR